MTIINKILRDMEEAKIKYCHFKSNQHLKVSFNGNADFDILVDDSKKNDCTKILISNECKQFEPAYIGSYPGVENWIAFDYHSGILYHIHLHYQLITGKSLVKDYVLPWSQITLCTAKKSEEENIYIADQNLELILLSTRLILKSKISDSIKSRLGIYKMPSDFQKEFDYLKERVNSITLEEFTSLLYKDKSNQKFFSIINNNTSIGSKQFIELRRLVRREFKNNKRVSSYKAFILSKLIRCIDIIKKILSRKFGKVYITKKVTTSGGKIITFIGVDGSGKSTVSNIISKWLGRKIECRKYYMGTGDGEKNLFASGITFIKKFFRSKNNDHKKGIDFSSKEIKPIKFIKEPFNYLKKYIQALVIYSVVKDNYKKIIKMHQYRLNGGISILDRYPQLEQESINDGLKLNRYSKMLDSRIIYRLAQKERELMSIVKVIYPDIVFRLKISPEVSMSRKPDENFDYSAIKFKTESIDKLKFENSIVIDIDATEEFSQEILEIKRLIWERL